MADLNRSADVGDDTTSVGILTYGLYAVADRFVSRAAAGVVSVLTIVRVASTAAAVLAAWRNWGDKFNIYVIHSKSSPYIINSNSFIINLISFIINSISISIFNIYIFNIGRIIL